MARIRFYVQCKEDGEERVLFYNEPAIRKLGGVAALEATVQKGCQWYSPIGEEEVPSENFSADDKELQIPTVKALLEAWIEKGAPQIKGAIGNGAAGATGTTFASRYFFYKFRDEDGVEHLTPHSEAQVLGYGGIEQLELTIAEHTSWFYPIGTMLLPTWVEEPGKRIEIPFRRIKALVDAWLESGSPWKPGKFAQDLESPPKGQALSMQTPETT